MTIKPTAAPARPRFLSALLGAALFLAGTAALASSSYHATDDPDLVHEAEIGDLNAARATLRNNGQVDIVNDQGVTPLMRAAEHGHAPMAKLLLDAGAQINRPDVLGKTALIWAAEGGDGDVIDLLIKSGARLEQSTKEGITPMMAAARTGQVDAVQHLITAGAQVDRSDYSGRDALGWAQESHNSRIIQLLRAAQKH
jgi:ankyrin repeat protein